VVAIRSALLNIEEHPHYSRTRRMYVLPVILAILIQDVALIYVPKLFEIVASVYCHRETEIP
jgi:hypothetical protein